MTAETLKQIQRQLGRWFIPTVTRYRLHVEVHQRLNCPDLIEPFDRYAADIIGAPEDERDSLLAIEPVEPYVPHVTYRQYSMPVMSEMYGGSPPGNRGPQRKAKRKKRGRK